MQPQPGRRFRRSGSVPTMVVAPTGPQRCTPHAHESLQESPPPDPGLGVGLSAQSAASTWTHAPGATGVLGVRRYGLGRGSPSPVVLNRASSARVHLLPGWPFLDCAASLRRSARPEWSVGGRCRSYNRVSGFHRLQNGPPGRSHLRWNSSLGIRPWNPPWPRVGSIPHSPEPLYGVGQIDGREAAHLLRAVVVNMAGFRAEFTVESYPGDTWRAASTSSSPSGASWRPWALTS